MEQEKRPNNPKKPYHRHHRKPRPQGPKPEGESTPKASPKAASANPPAPKKPNANPNQNTNKNQNRQGGANATQQGSGNRHKGHGRRRHYDHKKPKPTERPISAELTVSADETTLSPAPLPTPVFEESLYSPSEVPPEYYEPLFPEEEPKPEVEDTYEGERVEVIGVRFKKAGKIYYFASNLTLAGKGDFVIVETARGPEFGEVCLGNTMVPETDIVPPLRPVLRIATPGDVAHNKDNLANEEEAFRLCNQKIAQHGLDMKLIEAKYTFDNSKLLFYFTSAGRVDFRDLVKDLASLFRTRIELRQIGIRDEAKLMGGLGLCGRPLCCASFLSDFVQVSIKMAKEQNLSLNSTKISGICGRLMCCLRYEHNVYEEEIRRTPAVDSVVRTPDGIGTITEINPLAGKVKVRITDKQDTVTKFYHRDDVTVLSTKNGKEKGENPKK